MWIALNHGNLNYTLFEFNDFFPLKVWTFLSSMHGNLNYSFSPSINLPLPFITLTTTPLLSKSITFHVMVENSWKWEIKGWKKGKMWTCLAPCMPHDDVNPIVDWQRRAAYEERSMLWTYISSLLPFFWRKNKIH